MANPDRGKILIASDLCKGCDLCVAACPPEVLTPGTDLNRLGYYPVVYRGYGCTGCGICFYVCPEPGAITVFTRVSVQEDHVLPSEETGSGHAEEHDAVLRG